jgi:acetone carboxylase gamma subunit
MYDLRVLMNLFESQLSKLEKQNPINKETIDISYKDLENRIFKTLRSKINQTDKIVLLRMAYTKYNIDADLSSYKEYVCPYCSRVLYTEYSFLQHKESCRIRQINKAKKMKQIIDKEDKS